VTALKRHTFQPIAFFVRGIGWLSSIRTALRDTPKYDTAEKNIQSSDQYRRLKVETPQRSNISSQQPHGY